MPNSLQDLVRSGRLRRHKTTAAEVADLLDIAERRLNDARAEVISADLRFSAAYGAVVALATAVLYGAGYRTRGAGHHATTFEVLPLVMGEGRRELAEYFDICRQKRNVAEYVRAGQIGQKEVEELVQTARRFEQEVREWLRAHHPELAGE